MYAFPSAEAHLFPTTKLHVLQIPHSCLWFQGFFPHDHQVAKGPTFLEFGALVFVFVVADVSHFLILLQLVIEECFLLRWQFPAKPKILNPEPCIPESLILEVWAFSFALEEPRKGIPSLQASPETTTPTEPSTPNPTPNHHSLARSWLWSQTPCGQISMATRPQPNCWFA